MVVVLGDVYVLASTESAWRKFVLTVVEPLRQDCFQELVRAGAQGLAFIISCPLPQVITVSPLVAISKSRSESLRSDLLICSQ